MGRYVDCAGGDHADEAAAVDGGEPRAAGRGKTVTTLGAGVSGLCAAYERAGGRSLTLPRGDALKEKATGRCIGAAGRKAAPSSRPGAQ